MIIRGNSMMLLAHNFLLTLPSFPTSQDNMQDLSAFALTFVRIRVNATAHTRRKKGALNEGTQNDKSADATTAEFDSSGGRAPPAKRTTTTEGDSGAKGPSPPPARRAKKTTADKVEAKSKTAVAAGEAVTAAGSSTPGSSRARGRRCGKCEGCSR